MNLLPRWSIALTALLPLAAGCAGQPTTSAPEEVVKPPARNLDTRELPDCCKVPSRSEVLVFSNTRSMKVPPVVQQPNPTKEEKLITDFLKPAAPGTTWILEKQRQKPLPPPSFLEQPEALVPPLASDLIRPPVELTPVVLLPRPLAEDAPLTGQRTEQKLPKRQPLPAKPLVRLPQVDLEKPVELPPLAKFQPDRAPLTDVTGAVSLEAVLMTPIPVRATPEPFVRFRLPDPFEFRSTRLPPPAEEK